jgi:hypothetical protein
MASERTTVRTQVELAARAQGGATLGELLDHVEERNRELDGGSFTDAQDGQLQLYCWVAHERLARGALWGEQKTWEFLEQDIGG